MKVLIKAASGDKNYPTICGWHDCNSIEEAVEFVRYGAKGINKSYNESLILDFVPCNKEADLEIVIYDSYVE